MIKNCIDCGIEFETFDARKRRCNGCAKEIWKKKREIKSKNLCHYCGRRMFGKWKNEPEEERVCSFCKARGKGKKDVRNGLGKGLELNVKSGVVECPECDESMISKNGRLSCKNERCNVIFLTRRKGVIRDCSLEKAEVVS